VLGLFGSLEIAHKIVLSLYLVAFPLAVRALARALGRSEWLAFGAFALAYCPSVVYGYEAYLLAAVFFFFALAALARWKEGRRAKDLRRVALFVTLAYTCHAVPWLLLFVIAGLVARRALLAFVPSALLAGGTILGERLEHGYMHDSSAGFRGTWRDPLTATVELPRWTSDLFPGPLDTVLLAVMTATIVALAARFGARLRPLHVAALAVVAAAYFALPFEVSRPVVFFMISARLPLLLAPLALLVPARVPRPALAAPLVVVSAILPAWLVPLWKGFDARAAPFIALVERIPLGAKTFVARRNLMPPPLPAETSGDPATSGPAHWCEHAWPVLLRGGYSPYLFDQGVPVVYTKRLEAPPFPPRDGLEPREAPGFDYYLFREPSDAARADPAVTRVAGDGAWELYRRR
jgi:hypothetical protein